LTLIPDFSFTALPVIILPKDSFVITDVLLSQTLIGAGVNELLLSYLKHSLYSQLVGYPAVIQRITKYVKYDRYYCIKSLLQFLISIIDGVVCRNKADESAILAASLSLVDWIIAIAEQLFTKISNGVTSKGEFVELLDTNYSI
jgi:mediator of RNA polymerase II transcription subunit 24